MRYRAGLPGWKLFAHAGATIIIDVEVAKDSEAGVFVATCADIGLVVEAPTLDELRSEVVGATEGLLELALNGRPPRAETGIRLSGPVFCAA